MFDIGKQHRAPISGADTWHAGAAFTRYKLSGQWAAARVEYYYAEHGVLIAAVSPVATAPDFLVRGASLNLDYAPAPHVLVRVGSRVLHSRARFLPMPLTSLPKPTAT